MFRCKLGFSVFCAGHGPFTTPVAATAALRRWGTSPSGQKTPASPSVLGADGRAHLRFVHSAIDPRKYLKNFRFYLAVCWMAAIVVHAAPEDTFKKANAAYEAGRFDQAVSDYETVLHDGRISPALAFNLGNAYFRTRRIGKALAAYEWAYRLDPGDEAIRHNLMFVRSLVQEQGLPREPLLEALKRVYHLFTLPTLAWIWAIFWDATLLGVFLVLIKRWPWPRTPLYILGSALIVMGGWLFALTYTEELTQHAVIITQNAECRSGPGLTYDTAFTLPEGKRVTLLQEQGGWQEIETAGEHLKGWILETAVQPLSLTSLNFAKKTHIK